MSSKYASLAGQPLTPSRVWSAALYIRLSREDDDLTSRAESNSITSQREFLHAFLQQHPEIQPFDYYVDDGWSGTNFDRPNFQRMIRDIESHRVDCVIVKDLSRLGRNAAETSNYIDNVFVRYGIRFIAVHNYIDTVERKMNAATHCITVGVQNVINESIAATTSVNVRGTLNIQRAQGKFIGSFACYGYKKDPDDHHQLIIDPPAAAIVRQIFDWYLAGKSPVGIAKQLNRMNIPNPTAYKKAMGLKFRHPCPAAVTGLWPDSSVRNILKNEMYTGTMIQGKNTTISFKHKQCRAVPEEDWYRVEGTHEAIISKETFDKVQSMFSRKHIRRSPQKEDVDLFAGMVSCADCGRVMSKKVNKHSYGTYEYYRCTTTTRYSNEACTRHSIRIDKMEIAVTCTIQAMIDTAINMSHLLDIINNTPSRNTETAHLQRALDSAYAQREKIQNAMDDLYPDWKNGVIEQAEYIRLREKLREQLATIETNIAGAKSAIEEFNNGIGENNKFLSAFKKYGKIEKLTRPILTELVDKILVYEGGKIEVCFKYMDIYEDLKEYIESNQNLLSENASAATK